MSSFINMYQIEVHIIVVVKVLYLFKEAGSGDVQTFHYYKLILESFSITYHIRTFCYGLS